jgi:hypothetical protein
MRVALLSIFLLVSLSSNGQSFSNSYYYGFNVTASPIQATINVNAGKSSFIDKKNKFGIHSSIKIGLTRLGSKVIYTTPNESDILAIDKIKKSDIRFANVNLNFGMSYNLSASWMIGVETDLLGFNWSEKAKGEFSPSDYSRSNGPTRVDTSARFKVNNTNLMLFSDKNKGAIQNAIYGQYTNGAISFKFSIAYISTSIKTDTFIGNKGNSRFVNNDISLGLGMVYNFKK